MAKVFGRIPKDYLRTQSANDLIGAVASRQKCLPADIVKVVNGGNNPGTWMHEDVALDFAQWLSVDFKLWCNDRIKELMEHGATALNPEKLLDPDYVINVMQALKKERAEKELAQSQIEAMKPKALFADAVSASSSHILVGDLAKLIAQNGVKIGQNRLYKWLVDKHYLICRKRWSVSKQRYENDYMPSQRSMEMNLFWVHERYYTPRNPQERPIVKHTCYVTGKGQSYFINKFISHVRA